MSNNTEGIDFLPTLSKDKLFGIYTNTIYSFIGVLSILGNGIVVFVFIRVKSLRNGIANTFILNQSCVDGLTGLIMLTNGQISEIPKWLLRISESNKWIFEVYCRLWLSKVILWGLMVTSTYNIVIVTMDRYFSIMYPILHRRHMTKKKVSLAIKSIWLFGLGFNLAYMIPTSETKGDKCIMYQKYPSHMVQTIVGCLVLVIQYTIPIVIIVYCYIRIFQKISFSNTDITRSNAETITNRVRRNVIRTLLIVSACFIACWSPNQLLYAMINMGVVKLLTNKFFHLSVCLVYLNSCCNPLIYALSYDSFKKASKKAFLCRNSIQREPSTKNNVYVISN